MGWWFQWFFSVSGVYLSRKGLNLSLFQYRNCSVHVPLFILMLVNTVLKNKIAIFRNPVLFEAQHFFIQHTLIFPAFLFSQFPTCSPPYIYSLWQCRPLSDCSHSPNCSTTRFEAFSILKQCEGLACVFNHPCFLFSTECHLLVCSISTHTPLPFVL